MKKLSMLTTISFALFLTACSTTRAPSVNFLEIRSDYNGASNLKDVNDTSSLFVPNRTKPKQVDIYIHPHETVHGDYFRGGYIRSIVQGGQWELTETQPPVTQMIKKENTRPPRNFDHVGSHR
ncbi:MAG: hypothetical protein COW00_02785 [Bdellovibrio sp. CG12_big_fil_rev_8_21_14_0_65_39_13]|nr:MAG: hypothetical protein COW00_02785 [Bdellovibrio sp. CG12_big_fil_rev_8_21_14_0_65_39_13]